MANSNISSVLKDVVAYVDVWSSDKTANYSKPFIQQLQEMGAEVSKTFNKQVTHVVFNNGHPATWRKAKKSNVKLVSVLWVGRCYEEALQVDEKLFPALNDETNPVLKNKKHRCMQPKDSPERTPENDKRMKKKLDKMMKDLVPVEPLVTDVSPIIIDEKNGIVYSPALKRSDYMARRLKDMKEKRENLSPTASQMVDSPSGLKPSIGNTPTVFRFPCDQSDEDSSASVAETACPPAKVEGRTLPDISDHGHECLTKDKTEKPWMSPCLAVLKKTSVSPLKCPDFEENDDEEVDKQKRTRRKSVKRTETNKPRSLSETPDLGTSYGKNYRKKETRRSQIKLPSSTLNEGKHSPHQSDTKEGQQETKAEQSLKETNTRVPPKKVKSSTRLSSTDTSARLSKDTAFPVLLKEHTKSKQAPQFALVRPISLPSQSHNTASCSTDGDDVFEDYFSPANLEQILKKPVFSNVIAQGIQIPFVLDSDTKKKKPRRSESSVSETNSTKKRKVEETVRLFNQPEAKDKPEKPSQKDKQLLPDLDSSGVSASLTQLTKKQSALPFTSICVTSTRHRRLSLSDGPTKSEETDTSLESHKESEDSHTLTSRGNEHTVATGLTDAASEDQNRQESTSFQKMVNRTKVMRTLVMTSVPTEKQNTVVQVVKALGGFSIVDRVCASTTHVVSGGHRRTLNILLGIARGCWILSFEWILWSLEKRQWIPEEPYELSDQFPAAQICRLQRHLSAGEHQQDLFQAQPAMFVSQHSQPPTQSLIELIQLCGGTVCKTVRQAGICIGKYNGRRPEGSRILSEQWVLDSITHLKQLSYDEYTLE